MLKALIEGEKDPVKLADFAQRKLRGKIPELEKALDRRLTAHHQFMLRQLWKQLTQEEELIAELDARIEEEIAPQRGGDRAPRRRPRASIGVWPRWCWPKWETI